jgi:hypothetical protein
MNDKVEGTGGRTIPLTPYLASLLLSLQRLNVKRNLKLIQLRTQTQFEFDTPAYTVIR